MRITGPDIPAVAFSPALQKSWTVNADRVLAAIQKLAKY
jgi:pyruvate/2-oxoglutarate/acetoin dehydrogenase E1 component